MTTAEMQKELEARYAREYMLVREAERCDSDAVELLIRKNAERIDWLQEQLSKPAA